jgi:hypothetical protein
MLSLLACSSKLGEETKDEEKRTEINIYFFLFYNERKLKQKNKNSLFITVLLLHTSFLALYCISTTGNTECSNSTKVVRKYQRLLERELEP